MPLRPELRVAALVALAVPTAAHAQLTITGRVTDDGGRPIAGAQVGVPGTAVGALAGDDGTYRLVVREPRGPTALLVRYVGYRPGRATIAQTSGTATQDFSLVRDVLQLSQVVTTGTRTETERAQLGATLATVEGAQLANAATPQLDVALAGKVAGALVQQNSGTPGGGTSVRIRGLSTISRSAEPLYIIDGVIVDNSSRQLVDLGGYTTNRLADLDPNDIDRVEVVKGAAAAALYGSRANDGVVQIFTKRGRAGALRTTFRQTYGTDEVENFIDVNRAPVNLAGQPVTRYDYQDDIFRTARSYNTSLNLSGGDERTQFYLSGALQDQQGVIRATDYRRQNVRLNLDRQLTDWLKLNTSTNYVASDADLSPNGGIVAQYGVLTNFLFMSNDRSLYADPVTGQYPLGQSAANPLDVIANWRAPQEVNRYVGGVQLQATPRTDVTVDYRFGYDAYTENASIFIPRGTTATAFPTGMATSASNRARLLNSDLDVSWRTRPASWLQVTPSVGMNWQQQRFDVVVSRAEDLVPFTETLQGSRQFANEGRDDRRTLGFYGQAQIGVRELLFVTAALRSDASSAFGADERTQYFPKLGASFDVSGMPWWQDLAGSAVSRLRLRAAFGYSGGQPAESFARFSNYTSEPAGALPGVANSPTLGNDSLKPERQRETEIGADIELLRGRLGIEATWFDKTTSDLILPRAVRPSSGFSEQLANVGELRNRGLELLVRSVNLQGPRLGWNTSLTLTTSDPQVTRLSTGGAFFIPGSFNIIRVATEDGDGSAPGHFHGTTYVRNAEGQILDAAGRPIADASGRIVGIPAIGPRAVIGNPNPRAFFSFANDVTIGRRLTFRAQFDGVNGVDVFNFDRRLLETPAFGSGAEYARELTGEVPRGYFAARRGVFEEYVEKGDFVKLRELSVSYTIGAGLLRRVGARGAQGATLTLAGRNLKTWTDYTGWDPETNAGAQSTLVRGFAFATTPIPRNVTAAVTVNF
ncbi:MAG: TonB-dependent receptor plug domain-containing protein [Gemmatirosa sp.]